MPRPVETDVVRLLAHVVDYLASAREATADGVMDDRLDSIRDEVIKIMIDILNA